MNIIKNEQSKVQIVEKELFHLDSAMVSHFHISFEIKELDIPVDSIEK